MTSTVTRTLGRFVWRELLTRDVESAKRFYGEMFGWTFEDRPMGPDWSYTLVSLGGKPIGGMMDLTAMPDGASVPPNWSVYVSVSDVDETAKRAVAEGGRILSDCHDIPGVGRFAVLQDPQGAVFSQLCFSDGDPEDGIAGTHDFCWESLMTPDRQKAGDFYRKVIGWGTRTMGDAPHETLIFNRQGAQGTMDVASVGPAPEGAPAHWGTFVDVEDILASGATCQALGGKVIVERTDIPNVGAFAVLQDPTDAMIFLFERQPC